MKMNGAQVTKPLPKAFQKLYIKFKTNQKLPNTMF